MLDFAAVKRLEGDSRKLSPVEFHRDLARWNRRRLAPATPHDQWEDELEEDQRMLVLEGRWIERLRRDVRARAPWPPSGQAWSANWRKGP